MDKDGGETAYTYGINGELEQIKYSDGKEVMLSYNALQQLSQIKDWLGITRIEHNEEGRIQKIIDHKGQEKYLKIRKILNN